MLDKIRALIAEHGKLPVSPYALTDDSDLYAAGLTSLAAVQLMLALERRFNVEFLDSMLKRRSFASIGSIADCIHHLWRAEAA